METTKIVDLIMKDHLSDASDAVKDVIMNKAAEILTLEKERVGADMFSHLDPANAEDPTETEVTSASSEEPEGDTNQVPAPDENETNN
tara:strand:+ start:465 stop:728 length:264 start_codon:yes stop_codon:yes gene_type:complete